MFKPKVCDSCQEYVGKESLAGAPHKVTEALRYLLLPEADKIKFWRLTEVFKMKISIMSKGKRKMAKILYGCDPECVTTYNVGDKIFALPPWYFRRELSVPASADKRHPVFLERNGWKLHEDGAAFEMSVTPSHDPYELFQTVQDCRNTAEKEILSHFTEVCDGKLNFLPAVGWDVERWMQMRNTWVA